MNARRKPANKETKKKSPPSSAGDSKGRKPSGNTANKRSDRADPPAPLDPQDEASWESFPASDAPAH